MTIRPVHALCRSAAPYRIEVGGVLTAAGVRRGPHLLTVLASGSWEVRAGTSDAVRARFPESLVAPALYDAHVHLHPSVDLADYVAHGVTRVRDLGSRVGAGQELPTARDCADPLPDVVLGGPVLSGPGRPRLPIAAEWDHADDLPALVDAAARRGARWLKLYTRFPVELYPVAVDHAHAHGLRVTAHCRPGGYAAAVRAGVDELQHLA
ncbi:MAG: hypothetical protein HOV94_37155, partial [Saccharothrix sp.]|nr:hypothetical protein [Saccharothrix sp.]